MANNRCTYQQVTNVSINKDSLLEIAADLELTKKDYEVLLCLFTELDGWAPSSSRYTKDPLNFKKIDVKAISEVLDLDKQELKKSIRNLIEAGIIECGDSETIKDGYRFTF